MRASMLVMMREITDLHLAAAEGHINIIRLLVNEFDAIVDVRNDAGRTPLHVAAMK